MPMISSCSCALVFISFYAPESVLMIKKKRKKVVCCQCVQFKLCLRSTGCAPGRRILQDAFALDESNRLDVGLLDCASKLGNDQKQNLGMKILVETVPPFLGFRSG